MGTIDTMRIEQELITNSKLDSLEIGETKETGVGEMGMVGHGGTITGDQYGNVMAGDAGSATVPMYGTARAGKWGVATAGDSGAAIVGDSGDAVAGECGIAIAGDYGTAITGDKGRSSAGEHGKVSTGKGGTLQLSYLRDKEIATVTAVVGENGIEPDKLYELNEKGEFAEVILATPIDTKIISE